MKIPFVGPSYQSRSPVADAQRALNCYLEMDNASPRAPVALYGTPGLRLLFTLGHSPVRGAIVQGAFAYFVAGNSVYRVNYLAGYTAALLGTINSNVGPVGMASNGTEVLIVDGVNGYLATAATLTQVSDGDFPNGVRQCAYQDGYFIVTGDGSERFYINETPRDGTSWSGVDFASAEGSPDNTVACVSDHRELWLFGSHSAEIWVNTGNPDFPFERTGNAFLQVGTAAANSVQAMDNTLFWLGQDQNGGGIVFKAQGYNPVRISTHAMELAFQSYERVDDAISFTYQQDGHSFYVLTFPTAEKTWVYDVAIDQWHERAYRSPSTAALTRWRPSCHVFFNGEHLVGDYESGNVYALDLDTYTDNDAPILRLRVTETLADTNDFVRLFIESVLVDMQTGVGVSTGQGSDPQVMLRYLDLDKKDQKWSDVKTKSIGGTGHVKRVKFGPQGSTRLGRLWELSMTDPVKFAVFGAAAAVRRGS